MFSTYEIPLFLCTSGPVCKSRDKDFKTDKLELRARPIQLKDLKI